MTDHPQRRSTKLVPLVQCSVLYFGSAVPLETVAGLDSFKMPLRQRYTLTDDAHLLGIDATLTVCSAGMLVRYTADESSSAWFPMQALHVCAALKAFRKQAAGGGGGGLGGIDFAAVDSSLAKDSRHPPIFAFINRRTKGIKVLECHMFVCNSVTDATTLVQSCMYAYEHKDGWVDVDPLNHTSETSLPRIIPADHASYKYAESGIYTGGEGIRDDGLLKEDHARVPLRGFLHDNKQELIHKYNVNGYEDNEKERVGQTNFQGHRTLLQEQPAVANQRQLPYRAATDDNTRTSSAFRNNAPVIAATGTPQVHYNNIMVPKEYFTDGVNHYGSVSFMYVPAPSFHPINNGRNLKQKKKQNKVQKSEKANSNSKSSTKKADEENEDEIIEECYYVKKSSIYATTAYYDHHQSTTGIQETRGRPWDEGPRRMTMPPHHPFPSHQTGYNTSGYPSGTIDHQYITRSSHPFPPHPPHQTAYIKNRYPASGVDHQYVTRSVPNIPRTREGNPIQQHHRHGSAHDHSAIDDVRLDSQNALEHARNMERTNEQSNRVELNEPIPDYPNDPAELHSDIRRYDTGFHRTSQQILHRVKEDEARNGDHSRVTDGLKPLRDNVRVQVEQRNGHCECDKMPSTESEGKPRGYAELLGDLGYMP